LPQTFEKIMVNLRENFFKDAGSTPQISREKSKKDNNH